MRSGAWWAMLLVVGCAGHRLAPVATDQQLSPACARIFWPAPPAKQPDGIAYIVAPTPSKGTAVGVAFREGTAELCAAEWSSRTAPESFRFLGVRELTAEEIAELRRRLAKFEPWSGPVRTDQTIRDGTVRTLVLHLDGKQREFEISDGTEWYRREAGWMAITADLRALGQHLFALAGACPLGLCGA